MRSLFPAPLLASLLGAPLLAASVPVIPAGAPHRVNAREGTRQEMVYYVWDTGDGRLIPTAQGFAEATAPAELVWFSPGTFQPSWRATGLSGWTSKKRPAAAVEVAGTAPALETLAEKAFAAGAAKGGFVLDLPGARPIDWLVLQPAPGTPFPRHFIVQSALGPSGPWYPVPSAQFAFFPDPEGKQVWVPLRGLVAGTLRVLPTRPGPPCSPGTLRALGGRPPLFEPGAGGPAETALWNNLWLNFGTAANEIHQRFDPWWETDRPLDGGMLCIGSCEWLSWGAQKIGWFNAPEHPAKLAGYIAGNPVDEGGVVWAAPGSPKHLGHSIHYVNNALYPMAVARLYLQRRDPAFLEMKDPKTGETVLSKARRAFDHLLGPLGGQSGLVALPDGDTDGTPASKGSNYWDFWLFGHHCAYTNGFFYEALRWVAELEESLGNTARAAELRALRPLVKQRFHETFWNPQAGRYTGWIDSTGKSHDYGFPSVNLQALAFGLADDAQAASVLDWLDGKRIIPGEDSTGADIYHFGFAPRANTLDARHGAPPVVNTWGGLLDVNPGGSAAYGTQIQNGGAIFYVAYYDLLARLRHRGTAGAMRRAAAIADEFHKDHLRRDPSNNEGASDIVGILREFPESGLVPLFFPEGLLGIEPCARGLRIAPRLPDDWPSAAVSRYAFAGRTLSLRADRAAAAPVFEGGSLVVPAQGAWILTPDGKVLRDE